MITIIGKNYGCCWLSRYRSRSRRGTVRSTLYGTLRGIWFKTAWITGNGLITVIISVELFRGRFIVTKEPISNSTTQNNTLNSIPYPPRIMRHFGMTQATVFRKFIIIFVVFSIVVSDVSECFCILFLLHCSGVHFSYAQSCHPGMAEQFPVPDDGGIIGLPIAIHDIPIISNAVVITKIDVSMKFEL